MIKIEDAAFVALAPRDRLLVKATITAGAPEEQTHVETGRRLEAKNGGR